MRQFKDSGRFVFNLDNPLIFLQNESLGESRPGGLGNQTGVGSNNSNTQTTPHKPDNMPVVTVTGEEKSPDSLYTYSMGISGIQAHNNNYDETNAFVTKPIRLNENILEVTIDSVEEHPVFQEVSGRASSRQTSVEYYISLKETPSLNDWIPILPKQTKKVLGERLMFRYLHAETLFPFNLNSVSVYKDGLLMDKKDYYILNSQNIQIENVDTDSIYTIDYEPNVYIKNPYKVEVNDYKKKTERITEDFKEGTDVNKTLTLKHVPYIDKERLSQEEGFNPNTSNYQPVQVSIVDARIQGSAGRLINYVPPKMESLDSPYMMNRTLYLDNSWSDLKRYNLEEGYLGLDYYQHKNKITLAEHINIPMIAENERETPGTGTIRVSYDALVTSFRLKIIVRRNTQQEITVSPRVKEYKLNFKSTR